MSLSGRVRTAPARVADAPEPARSSQQGGQSLIQGRTRRREGGEEPPPRTSSSQLASTRLSFAPITLL